MQMYRLPKAENTSVTSTNYTVLIAKTLLLPLNDFRSFITKLLSVGRSAHATQVYGHIGDMCDTCHLQLQESMAEGLTHILRG